jgi:tRNA nucleotidyltransferase (CCA-adding enzyme)
MRAPAALLRASFPEPVLEVLRRLDAAGHRSWLVGGAVRDLLLHRQRTATDFDVATPATPREVMALFRRVIPTGVDHGTVTVLVDGDEKVEVTTFRGEGAYVDGRRPGSVTFHTDLDEDLGRRDFTMNAMAFDPLERVFRDPFGGREDMRRRRIRAVGDPAARFGEDGLRPMRAVRFAAQLGYDLEPRTRAAIPGALEVVRLVSVERIAEELSRLVGAPHAEGGLGLLRQTGLLPAVLPELAEVSVPVYAHSVAVLGHVPPAATLRFAALLHALGAEGAEAALIRLRLPRRLSDEVRALLRPHACRAGQRAPALPVEPAAVRRWLSASGPPRANDLLVLAEAEVRAIPPGARRRSAAAEVEATRTAVESVLAASPPLSTQELAIDGSGVMAVLGAGPGAHVGEALRHLLDRVLADPARNTRDQLEAELRLWWAGRVARL